MEVEILACPFCGWNHSRKQSRKRPEGGGIIANSEQSNGYSFSNIDPSRVLVYQRRTMGGGGRGRDNKPINMIEGQHLWELPEDLKNEIRDQAKRILALLT